MEEYLFSIIIPIYNNANFLEKCIKSVLNQKIKDVQVILVNDRSTDGSEKICKKYRKKFNLNLINNKKRLGVSISRNNGIKLAKGKYIVFLDSDDYLLKNSLIKLKKIILNNKFPDVVLNNCKRNRIPSNFNYILNLFGNKIKKRDQFFSILNKNKIILNECWSLVISKKLIIKNKVFFQKTKIAEDIGFIIKVFLLMKNIVVNKNALLFHLSRLDSLKHTLGVEAAYSYIVTLAELSKLLKKYENIYFISKYLEFRILRIIFYLGSYVTILNKRETVELSLRIKNFVKEIKILKNTHLSRKINFNLKSKSSLDMIASHQNFVNKRVMLIFKKKFIDFTNISIFCADMAARAVVKIFKKNKISINSIYDEDSIFKRQKISNIPIKILTKKKFGINNLEKKMFIVCNFDKNTFTNISKKLIKRGLTKNKIFHLYY